MSRAYHERRRVMEAALETAGLEVAGKGTFGGSSFWMRARGVDTHDLAARLRGQSVLIEPGAPFFATTRDPPVGWVPTHASPTEFYRLAYSSIPAGRIAEGVGLVAG